jgi:hypothetical protein
VQHRARPRSSARRRGSLRQCPTRSRSSESFPYAGFARLRWGGTPVSRTACWTRPRTCWDIRISSPRPLKTNEAVVCETPARRATSARVTRRCKTVLRLTCTPERSKPPSRRPQHQSRILTIRSFCAAHAEELTAGQESALGSGPRPGAPARRDLLPHTTRLRSGWLPEHPSSRRHNALTSAGRLGIMYPQS